MPPRAIDVLILGGGWAGAILAAILARHGREVVVLERAHHPRFALGEAGIKETSLASELLGRAFDVPELAALGSAARLRRVVGGGCGQKASFSFLWQAPGALPRPEHATQVGTPAFPFGVDAHYHRADVDAWLAGRARHHGAEVREGAEVTGVELPTREGERARVTTADGREYLAGIVVDGAGAGSPLANVVGEGPPLRTRTRCIYAHLRGVAPADARLFTHEVAGLARPLASGTVHHVFPGGWAWVIPFDNLPGGDNPRCSVGVVVDSTRFPPTGACAAEEVAQWLERLPGLGVHLEGAQVDRAWASLPRVQRRAAHMSGPGFVLLPHAGGFVDALFSRGLYLTTLGLGALAELLLGPEEERRAGVAAYGGWFAEALDVNDRLVWSAFGAFEHPALWNAWHRIWGLGVLLESGRMAGQLLRGERGAEYRPQSRYAFPLDIEAFRTLFEQGEAAVDAVRAGKTSPEAAAEALFDALRQSPLDAPMLHLSDPHSRALALHHPFAMARLGRWARGTGHTDLAACFDHPKLPALAHYLHERLGA